MKVGIVGSQCRKDKKAVEKLVESLPEGTTIVSGGGKGVDKWAAEAGRERGFPIMEFLQYKPPEDYPAWARSRSGYSRNQKIVEASDIIYAFVAEDRSGETEDIVKCAEKFEVPVELK